jgi:hypothetical protein
VDQPSPPQPSDTSGTSGTSTSGGVNTSAAMDTSTSGGVDNTERIVFIDKNCDPFPYLLGGIAIGSVATAFAYRKKS